MQTVRFKDLGVVHCVQGARQETKFIYREVFTDREYEHATLRWWPGMTIVDVGANVGFFAIFAHQKCSGQAHLLCIEPIPATFSVLRRNLDDHGLTSARAVNLGLTCFGGPSSLEFIYYPRAPANSTCKKDQKDAGVALLKHWTNDPAGLRDSLRVKYGLIGRLLAPFLRRAVNFAIRKTFKGIPIVCPLTNLTAVCRSHGLESVDLLKIDVEGAEWDVLNGIDDALWPRIRQLALEVEDFDGKLDQVIGLLRHRGFDRIEVVRPKFAEGIPNRNYNVYAAREHDQPSAVFASVAST